MASRWTHHLDEHAIRSAVDAGTYARGAQYATDGLVLSVSGRGGDALLGTVRGGGRRTYQTLVTFDGDGGWRGACSCPVTVGCKHAVALLLVARAGTPTAAAEPGGNAEVGRQRFAALADAVRDPADDGLLQLRGIPRTASPRPATVALEVRLTRPTPQQRRSGTAVPRLAMRPLAREDDGRYVRSGVSWRDLQYLNLYAARQVTAPHREALTTLHQMAARHSYGYRASDAAVHADEVGRVLWALLAQIEDAGIPLVTGEIGKGRRLTDASARPVRLVRTAATIALDARRADRTLSTSGSTSGSRSGEATGRTRFVPVLDLDGDLLDVSSTRPVDPDQPVPLLLGSPAHGIALPAPADGLRLGRHEVPAGGLLLVPLAADAHEAVAGLLGDGPFEVPTEQVRPLLDRYHRAVRQVLPLVSSDASVEVPTVAPPVLHLNVHHEPDHRLTVTVGLAYPVGDSHETVPLAPAETDAVARDPAAEQALLHAVTSTRPLPPPLLALLARAQLRPDALLPLVGLDTARFVTEVLPDLRERDDVHLTETGTALPYREATGEPQVRLSATESHDQRDWFDLQVDVHVDGEAVPNELLLRALALGESHVMLPSGTVVDVSSPTLARLRELLAEARALQEQERGPLRLSVFQADLWAELVELGVVAEQADRWRETVAALTGPAPDPPPLPAGLHADLRPYQRDGYEWLARLAALGLGGVLADDMGLGKTVQALALICHRLETAPEQRPFLVVAPTSVVPVWAEQAARFAPGLRVAGVDRTSTKSGLTVEQVVADADVVVTSYTLLRLEDEAYVAQEWAGVLLDEAQHVKNRNGRTHQAVRRLRAGLRVAITGTPMENDLMELWSILSIVAPGLFPHPTRFREHYATPIATGSAPERLATLRRRIRPLLLRRTKEHVAPELPEKTEQVLHVQLDPRHRRLYDRQLAREQQKVLRLIDDPNRNRFEILRSLTLLRRLALDAALLDEAHDGIRSAKVDTLVERLVEIAAEGHRALVFSQFTGFLARVRPRLQAAGVDHVYLDGRTRDRGTRVERWRTGGAPAFLISLKAGGSGLTLTEADYVFVLDPWWNPAVEAQAVDRTHRIGQTRNVMVYRLVSAGTIEDKVMELKARKQELVASVLDGDGGSAPASLDGDDLRELFGL